MASDRVVLKLEVERAAQFALNQALAMALDGCDEAVTNSLCWVWISICDELLAILALQVKLSLENLIFELERFLVSAIPVEEAHPASESVRQRLASMAAEEFFVELGPPHAH